MSSSRPRRAWITRGGLLKLERKSHYWSAFQCGGRARVHRSAFLIVFVLFACAYFNMLIRPTDRRRDGRTDGRTSCSA